MSDAQAIGFAFFGAILLFYVLYLGFIKLFPKPTEYEWKQNLKARQRWIEMMEDK